MPNLENLGEVRRRSQTLAAPVRIGAAACALCGMLLLLTPGGPLLPTLHAQAAQASAASNSSAPNYGLEGDWVRIDTVGAGNFGGLNKDVPKAQLTPEGKAVMAKAMAAMAQRIAYSKKVEAEYSKEKLAAGQVTVVVPSPCQTQDGGVNTGDGAVSFNPDSGGFHMIVGRKEVIWSGERGGSLVIWMDGRPLPDETNWAHPRHISVGHWENGVLVVKTVGLPAGGGFGIPGGGVRLQTSVLTIRFELTPDGKQMKMINTYSDPRLYLKPHTWTYTMDRAFPKYALEEWCDPGNPLDYESVGPPPQDLK